MFNRAGPRHRLCAEVFASTADEKNMYPKNNSCALSTNLTLLLITILQWEAQAV